VSDFLLVVVPALLALAGGLAGVLVSERHQRRRHDEVRQDAERERKRGVYGEYGWTLGRLEKYVTGYDPSRSDWEDWLDHHWYHAGLARLVGTREVVEAVDHFGAELEKVSPLLSDAAASGEWRTTFLAHGGELRQASRAAQAAMNADLDPAPDRATSTPASSSSPRSPRGRPRS